MPRVPARLGFALAVTSGMTGCAPPPSPPSILLVTLDTTRVDHLSCYGYERDTSPNLDALAAESVRFTRAWSTSSWTLPAHASLFTGLYPSSHGVQFDAGSQSGASPVLRLPRLDERFETLAERLAARGYQTAAFVGGPWLERTFGLLQGFQHVDDELPDLSTAGRPAGDLTERALAWLASADAGRPIFLFVNYFDPHDPYEPPPGFDLYPAARMAIPRNWTRRVLSGWEPPPRIRKALRDRYDGEIRAMDHQLGRLLAAVRDRPDGDRTLVIVTADHGESFGEDGFWLHNGSLGEETVRVPLVVRYPDGRDAGRVRDDPVQIVDVVPLIAAELGEPLPDGVQGVVPGERTRAYLELRRNPSRVRRFGARYDRDLEAVIEGDDKLVVANREQSWLHHLDGIEERPVPDSERKAELVADLEAHRTRVAIAPASATTEVDPQTAEALRELGYVD